MPGTPACRTRRCRYGYLLDFDNGDAISTQAYGLRARENYPFNNALKDSTPPNMHSKATLLTILNDIDTGYYFAETGLDWSPSGSVDNITLKLNYELQEGSGDQDRFVTIMGTNHPFQGWADCFLVTPGDGVGGICGSVTIKAYGARFVIAYHDFSSDNYNYGTELNLLATKSFARRYTSGIKYIPYDGDNNSLNKTRNPTLAADVDKS